MKQLLTEDHRQKKMQSLESWNGDRVFSLAGLQSTRHLLHNPDLLTCRLASSESQHHEADWQRGKSCRAQCPIFCFVLVQKHNVALGDWVIRCWRRFDLTFVILRFHGGNTCSRFFRCILSKNGAWCLQRLQWAGHLDTCANNIRYLPKWFPFRPWWPCV